MRLIYIAAASKKKKPNPCSQKSKMSVMLPLLFSALTIAARDIDQSLCEKEVMSAACVTRMTERVSLYGLPTIERRLADYSQSTRIFVIDDYGRDVVGIEFLRPAQSDPRLEIAFPQKNLARKLPNISIPIPESAFADVVQQGRYVTRSLVPVPEKKSDDGSITICMHPWSIYTEIVDPGDRETPPAIRRRMENTCDDNLLTPFGFRVAEKAGDLIPWCSLLNKAAWNAAELLLVCRSLEGDRSAAAHVRNRLDEMTRYISSNSDSVRWLFAIQPEIIWNGQKIARADGKAFAAKLNESGDRLFLGTETVRGLAGDRATSHGYLQRNTDTGYEFADIDLVWTVEGDEIVIGEANVGPFLRKRKP